MMRGDAGFAVSRFLRFGSEFELGRAELRLKVAWLD